MAWPPDVPDGDLPWEVMKRLTQDFRIDGIRRTGVVIAEGRHVAEVGLWPASDDQVEAVRQALAPMDVRVFPEPGVARRC